MAHHHKRLKLDPQMPCEDQSEEVPQCDETSATKPESTGKVNPVASTSCRACCEGKCLNSKELSWKLHPVLDDDIFSDLPLVEVYVGDILDSKQTSRLIKNLNEVTSILHLQHLKRVKRDGSVLKVIVDAADCETPGSCFKRLVEKGLDATGLSSQLQRISVPSSCPKTREQFEKSKKFWPCNFHEDKYLESMLNSTLFTFEKSKKQEHYMNLALQGAALSVKEGGAGIGAVVVDPVRDQPVAIGYDVRYENPLQHAVMVVLDLVARSQGGGVWDVGKGQWFEKAGNDCVSTERPACASKHANKALPTVPATGPYLCTGFDVYVTCEPCLMCAMALVHGRVRRLFYGCPSRSGALGSVTKLHSLKALNHHYEVFRGILEGTCTELCCVEGKS